MKTILITLSVLMSFPSLAAKPSLKPQAQKERAIAGKKSEKEGKYLDNLRSKLSGYTATSRL